MKKALLTLAACIGLSAFAAEAADPVFVFSPATGSEVESLSTATITVEGVTGLRVKEHETGSQIGISIMDPNRVDTPSYTVEGNTIYITCTEPITKPGRYQILNSWGAFEYMKEDGTYTDLPTARDYYINVNIDKNAATYATSSPADGSTINEFTEFVLTFPNAKNVVLNPDGEFSVSYNNTSYTGNFTLKDNDTKNFSFVYKPQPEAPETPQDGWYQFWFQPNCFTIDGDIESTRIGFLFYLDSTVEVAPSLSSITTSSEPAEMIPIALSTYPKGLGQVTVKTSKPVKINHQCEGRVELIKGFDVINSIDAGSELDPRQNIVIAETTEEGSTIVFNFDETLNLTDDGLYYISIPAGFFTADDEELSACRFTYSIGIGNWVPESPIDLSNPGITNAAVVSDKNMLTMLKLRPYATTTRPNDTDFQALSLADHIKRVAIQGVDAAATLYCLNNDKKTAVATFKLNSPIIADDKKSLIDGTTPEGSLVSLQKGLIVFDLRKGDNQPIAINGDYVLEMPWNFFRSQTSNNKVVNWPEFTSEVDGQTVPGIFTYKFTVTGGRPADAPLQTYTVTPEAGEYNPYPTVTLTYEGCSNITVKEGATAELYYGSSAATPSYFFDITADGNVVTLTPKTPVTEVAASQYTVYKLLVPEGSFSLNYDGKDWENYEVEITDFKMKAAKVCPDAIPALDFDNVKPEDVMTINFNLDGTYTGTIGNGITAAGSIKVYRVNDDGTTKVMNGFKSWKWNADKTGFSLTYKGKVTEFTDGKYQIVIPANSYYITVDGARKNCLAQTYTFTIDSTVGVETVEEGETLYNVFTLTGISVLRNGTADELKALAPGFYIINQKRVVIK